MNRIALMFIKMIHWMLILFLILSPFSNNEWILTLHMIIVPGIVIHWITNNNICSLTYLESKLSGTSLNETFIGQILHPFFEIDNKLIYCIILALWLITLWKLAPTGFRLFKTALYVIFLTLKNIFDNARNFFIFLFSFINK